MNAKEIVRALETEVLCENCPHNESNCPDDGCYYIMAAALIDKLQALAENGQSAIDTNMRLVKVVESLQAQLAEREKENERLREAQRWIPVGERTPGERFEDKGLYRVKADYSERSSTPCEKIAYWNGVVWIEPTWFDWPQNNRLNPQPTHWMPLPAPIEKGE